MRKRGTPRWRWWWVVGALATLAGLAVVGEQGMGRVSRLRAEAEQLQKEIQRLEADNEELARAVDRLRDDPSVIEQIAREELGMVKPGERVLRFPRK